MLGASSHIPWLVLAKLSKRQRLRFKRSLQEIPLWLAQRVLPSLRNYHYHKPEKRAYSLSSRDVYSVRFINHAPEPLQSPSFFQSGRIATNLQPSNGYALKKSSGKRVIFSLAQKEIMISFYNRQASSGVRADPKDVITCMRDRGVEVLKETQIRSWWSTYHQKRKQTLNVLQEEVCHLQRGGSSVSKHPWLDSSCAAAHSCFRPWLNSSCAAAHSCVCPWLDSIFTAAYSCA